MTSGGGGLVRTGGLGGAASGASDMVDDDDAAMHRGTAVSDRRRKKQFPLWSEGVCVRVCGEATQVCVSVCSLQVSLALILQLSVSQRRQTPIAQPETGDTGEAWLASLAHCR